jgi:hypothetical protein
MRVIAKLAIAWLAAVNHGVKIYFRMTIPVRDFPLVI